MNLTDLGNPVRLNGEAITPAFFRVLGVSPALGRNFLPAENSPGAPAVVIVTHDFWQRRLGADPRVLDRSVRLDAKPHRIVGVLPAGFESPAQLSLKDRIEIYTPALLTPLLLQSHGDHEVNVVARLAPGATMDTARAQLQAVSAALEKRYPNTNTGVTAAIAPLDRDLVRAVHDSLLAILGASALIVLITCVNVANLFLVRAIARRHETAVRLALGAGKVRIVRQFLAESLLIAGAGCAAGILVGQALMRLLVFLAPPAIPRIQQVALDWRVFAVAAAIATVTGIVFGLAPAWQASQSKPVDALKGAGRNTADRSQARWRTALPAVEIALSLILLIGAGLLIKSFVRLMGIDLGFQPERVLAVNLNLPAARYPSAGHRLRFFEQLAARVESLPGVQSAAYANRMPLRGGWSSGIDLDSLPGRMLDPDFQAVSPGYFETLGIPLLHGRKLTAADRAGTPAVALVNQAFSRHYLNGADPIGHRMRRGDGRPWVEIVGVVDDIRRAGKTADINPQVYLAAAQTDLYPVPLADFAIRSARDPRLLVNAIQAEVWSIDKDLPLTRVRTLEEIVSESVAQRRFQTLLVLVFAGVAVGLALVGIYGVLSYSVSQRTPELGLRIALGANPWRIVALVVRQAAWVIAGGVAAGLAGAWALSTYLESLLFQVKRYDPATWVAAVLLLAAVGVAAALIPARRGARVDPIRALRWE